MKKSIVLSTLLLLVLSAVSFADDGILTRKVYKGDLFIFGKGTDEGRIASRTRIEDTITRKKLSDGRLRGFSLGAGMGMYSGTVYDSSGELGQLEMKGIPYSFYLGYKKELFESDLYVFYVKPTLQYNLKTDSLQVSSLNLDLGMDIYEIENFTLFSEFGLNYSSWDFLGMTGTLGFDFNFGAYIADNYATGMKVTVLRGGNLPVLVGPILEKTDLFLTNVAWYFELR
jgi:hypothetical protein